MNNKLFCGPAMRGAAIIVAAFASHTSSASEWKYSLGTDISSGDYGDSAETEIATTPFTVSYSPSSSWTFKASLPWTQIEGPGGVVPGDGGVIVGPGNGRGKGNGGGEEVVINRESGVGDLWLTGTYSLEPLGFGTSAQRWFVDFSGKYKAPTADEKKGLGTGEADYTLQAEVFTAVGDFTPFLTVARKIKGDLPEVEIRDVWYTSVGSGYRLDERNSVGASLDYQQATTSTSDPSTEIFGYFNHKLNANWSGMAYAYLGLADGSPDQGFGFQLSYRPGS